MSEQEKKSVLPFGLLPADIIKIVTMFCIGVAFIVKTDQRIAGLESTMSYLSTFTKNSDGWNSSVYGVQFEGGKPINANLNMTQLHRNQ